ncbi:hypothetical protein MPH_06618 [Macrophomina phaseolina MS6]|uniref:Uncharacterized protein n=1 Tax=Macrophomina phaseolina (strain MS6) TaxID=1126212 RepID=K2R1T2_MACPH|nr:hypothetical protein MPH_06618 [Macrophomina phaseolina MS6]
MSSSNAKPQQSDNPNTPGTAGRGANDGVKYANVAYKRNGINYHERWAYREDQSGWRFWTPKSTLATGPSKEEEVAGEFRQEKTRWDFYQYDPQTGEFNKKTDDWRDYIKWPEN